jgi:Learning-associated protein
VRAYICQNLKYCSLTLNYFPFFQEREAAAEEIREEFIREKKEEYEKSQKIPVKNEKTGIVHTFDSKTLKDQFGTYPVWLNKNIRKRKLQRRKKDKQFWVGAYMPE